MRRVITGNLGDRSAVVQDEEIGWVHHVLNVNVGSIEARHETAPVVPAPDGQSYAAEIWETAGRVPPYPDRVRVPRPLQIEPPVGGTRIRYSVWGPNLHSAAMHATDTLDVNFVVAGDVEIILESETRWLHAQDWVVIPGVSHGWRAGPNGATLITIAMRNDAGNGNAEGPSS